MILIMKKHSKTFPQLSLLKSFLLYALPGVLATISIVLLKPATDSLGYPPLLVFLLVILFIDIPVLLGIMLLEGKKA